MKRLDKTRNTSSALTGLTELLLEQSRARPHDTAIVSDVDILTYRELVRRSSELAGLLEHLGVAADDCVGLFVEPSVGLMVGAWGILFAGGAYLPLSPEYPVERLRYMIEDSGTKVIVAQPDLADRLAELATEDTTIVTLNDAARFAAESTVPPPAPGSLAYVIYTSGSTGKPKGVMIEHRSIASQMSWLAASYGIDRDKTVLQKTPMSFDAAQWEILAPACGATVVMGMPGIYRDAERLIRTIREHGVTTLQCVPTLLQALLDTDELAGCTSLRQIFTGGEALPKPLAKYCLDTLPWCELVNLYGPTECTINSSAFTVSRATVEDGPNAVSIGTPVADTEYHILAADGAEAAVGEIGELHIGGIQLARGYLHQPELTAQRFVDNPFGAGLLFKTGDLAYWNADGTVQFMGRADNQVKLRGFRVELDEIKLAIETHDWVKHAAVVVKPDSRTGFQNLIACVELNPREAALMDQGNHGAHHQSKASKLQVKAQLSNAGARDAAELDGKPVVDLPGRVATDGQRRQAFARKTYRFYEGGEVTKADVLQLLGRRPAAGAPRDLTEVDLSEFGEILRYLGQHLSTERLLPKYAYASPGSLYATQLYLQITGIGDLRPGIYYYHPVTHQLVLITETVGAAEPEVLLHFVGKKRAIEPVYKNNIQEVLEIETGHMVGLLEEVLPGHGLDVVDAAFEPATKDSLEVADEDFYLGTFALVRHGGPRPRDEVDIYVQAHPGKVADLPAGQYAYTGGRLERISAELVLRKQVIAINQAVYDRASIGISVISRTGQGWRRYVDLGRVLQRLSMNEVDLGFMSSGYSSKSGDDLPSHTRIDAVLRGLGRPSGPSYFFVGGRVSAQQRLHDGMKEDVVHMRGPAEMIRDDLITLLPDYMIPNKVLVLDRLPTTVNGKIDIKALVESDAIAADSSDRPFVAPRTRVERRIAELWQAAMKREGASVLDDFFASGGNSLIAVGLINKLNREFGSTLPLQVLFESPTIEQLAKRVEGADSIRSSRLVPLQPAGSGAPVYCWPGLGGYTMNLRTLAGKVGTDRPFYGVQAHGINEGEVPYATIKEMATEDVAEIRRLQPQGPYTLWGYSFGARVAFEAAHQLEQAGERVENLFLIAPGSPKVHTEGTRAEERVATYDNQAYVTILFSVFSGTISGSLLRQCLEVAKDDKSLAEFLSANFTNLDIDLVARIIQVVGTTFEFSYTFRELTERRISAPITIFKARGDDYSFLEGASGYAATAPTVVELVADHYSMLKDPDIDELTAAIRLRGETQRATLDDTREDTIMPHVNIKHFPVSLSAEQQSELVSAVTRAMTNAFGCDDGAVSIAFEPIAKEVWNEQVYLPEIVNRRHTLGKVPNYGADFN
ncbi:amino acid adenylation domain-containing protein [Actinokineospora diospyrosa]|uniref:Amino acid adenylation domain-containing protein n=1 Tax=Actinokineospora diospyrosa TaxID=103728 RepID=A0ABT1I5M6_9PSEU|nr:amino acid adenylation domain-containing protein [Actinokineospora diospyrosa]MCP2267874.1 amino acid adenylation domain-containing protein [Actinokineospora diospyrosa]